MEPGEEIALVRAVAAGERDAFQRLVHLHQRPLFGFAQRMLQDQARAEDVVQETLLRLWSRAGSFKPERARLTTWLHNIAHNLCVDALRRESRFAPEEAGDHGESGHAGPSESEDRRRADAALRRALGDLPERQRSALLLCHYQGMSNREAAEVLEVSVEALESLLARARRALKKELRADDAD